MNKPPSAYSQRIGERNAAMAVIQGRRAASRTRGDYETDPFLTPVTYSPRTRAAIAAEKKAEAAERLQASRGVARHVRGLGCTGRDCTDGHEGHRAVRDDLLRELGVIPDPVALGLRSGKGWTATPKREAT